MFAHTLHCEFPIFSFILDKVQWGLTCSVVFAARAAAQCEVLAPSSIDTYFELNAQGSTLVAPYWLVIYALILFAMQSWQHRRASYCTKTRRMNLLRQNRQREKCGRRSVPQARLVHANRHNWFGGLHVHSSCTCAGCVTHARKYNMGER